MHSSALTALRKCKILSEVTLYKFNISDFNHQPTHIAMQLSSVQEMKYCISEIDCLPVTLANCYCQLRGLNIYDVTRDSTTVILSNCTNLEKLKLSYIEVSSDVISQISSEFLTNILIRDFVGYSQSSIHHLDASCNN